MDAKRENGFVGFVSDAAKAVKKRIRYDIVRLKIKSYVTESEQTVIALLLAALVLGLVKKYLMK